MTNPLLRAGRVVIPALLAACGFVGACDVLNPAKRDEGRVDPIEGQILFWVGEGYEALAESVDPKLMLFMTTEYEYGCCNFSIRNQITMGDAAIYIDLLGIYKPDICLTALGPATSTSSLDLVPGDYALQFRLGNSTDTYALAVTDSSVSVIGIASEFTTAIRRLVWRYPPKSFAYLCGTLTENSWICPEFLDSLLAAVPLESFQFPDSGYIPYPPSSQGHYYDMPALYFRYADETDFEAAGVALEEYAKTTLKGRTGVGLSLINWRNRHFHSWLLDD